MAPKAVKVAMPTPIPTELPLSGRIGGQPKQETRNAFTSRASLDGEFRLSNQHVQLADVETCLAVVLARHFQCGEAIFVGG